MASWQSLTVIRNTREEEETGRRELLGSTVMGRHASLTAALLVASGAVIGPWALSLGLVGVGTLGHRGSHVRARLRNDRCCVFRPRPGWQLSSPKQPGQHAEIAVGFAGLAFLLLCW